MSSFIASALVETVTEEKPEVLKTLLRMWQVLYTAKYQLPVYRFVSFITLFITVQWKINGFQLLLRAFLLTAVLHRNAMKS